MTSPIRSAFLPPPPRNGDLHGDEWSDRDGYRACAWCGSMHPADFAKLIRAGEFTRVEWADWKYGWPHKLYADTTTRLDLTAEELARTNTVWGPPGTTTRRLWNGAVKFYSVHLRHADPGDKALVEMVGQIEFEFDTGSGVHWRKVVT